MSYSFPILSNAEILACLTELDIGLTDAELQKPTYDAVRPVFEAIVQLLVGVTKEELAQPEFAAIDALEFPELHDESVGNLALLRALFRLVETAGISDFGVKDVYKPEAARLKKVLSAIINFAKFREEKVALYDDLREASEGAAVRKQQLEDEERALRAELERLEQARAAEEPAAQALEAELEDALAEVGTLNREQAALNAEVRQLKGEANQLADSAAAAKLALQNAREEGERLRSLIVNDPEKLRRALEETDAAVEAEKAATTEAQERARELGTRADIIAKVERDVTKCTSLMEEAQREVDRHKEVAHTVKASKAEVAQAEDEMWSLDAEKQHLKRQEQSLAERMQRLAQQGDLKQEQSLAELRVAQDECEALANRNAVAAQKIAENNAAAAALEQQAVDTKATHEAEMAAVAERYQALCRQVQEHDAGVVAALSAPAVAAQ